MRSSAASILTVTAPQSFFFFFIRVCSLDPFLSVSSMASSSSPVAPVPAVARAPASVSVSKASVKRSSSAEEDKQSAVKRVKTLDEQAADYKQQIEAAQRQMGFTWKFRDLAMVAKYLLADQQISEEDRRAAIVFFNDFRVALSGAEDEHRRLEEAEDLERFANDSIEVFQERAVKDSNWKFRKQNVTDDPINHMHHCFFFGNLNACGVIPVKDFDLLNGVLLYLPGLTGHNVFICNKCWRNHNKRREYVDYSFERVMEIHYATKA